MEAKKTKVVIVGTGNVGSAIAHTIAMEQLCNTLVLIDRNEKKAWAEATDLRHCIGYSDVKMDIHEGSYQECKDADIVVLTVSAPYTKEMVRLEMIGQAQEIIASIVPPIMESGFQGIFIVITNPVDVMAYLVQKLSGLPARQIIGTGTLLDSARLKSYIAHLLDVDARSVEAVCMGEHGDSQVIPWSVVTVGGKKFADILHDNSEKFSDVKLDEIYETISQIAYKITRNKGATVYGIAGMAGLLIKAVLKDSNMVLPVSVMLDGKYGEKGVFAGVPAVIAQEGVKDILEYHLSENELEAFHKSVQVVREADSSLKEK